MTIEQVKQVIDSIENRDCPLTENLIKSGFQQKDGYIKYAKECGIEVDFLKAQPSQEWHFYESFYKRSDCNSNFRFYPCGEFLFWLAEILDVQPKEYSLEELCEKVMKITKFKNNNTDPSSLINKKVGNNLIKEQCWNGIKQKLSEKLQTTNCMN